MAEAVMEDVSRKVEEYGRRVADKLLSARLSSNLEITDIAMETGIAESVMLGYERATEEIPVSDLFKIAGVVGMSVDYFFGEDTVESASINVFEQAVTAILH